MSDDKRIKGVASIFNPTEDWADKLVNIMHADTVEVAHRARNEFASFMPEIKVSNTPNDELATQMLRQWYIDSGGNETVLGPMVFDLYLKGKTGLGIAGNFTPKFIKAERVRYSLASDYSVISAELDHAETITDDYKVLRRSTYSPGQVKQQLVIEEEDGFRVITPSEAAEITGIQPVNVFENKKTVKGTTLAEIFLFPDLTQGLGSSSFEVFYERLKTQGWLEASMQKQLDVAMRKHILKGKSSDEDYYDNIMTKGTITIDPQQTIMKVQKGNQLGTIDSDLRFIDKLPGMTDKYRNNFIRMYGLAPKSSLGTHNKHSQEVQQEMIDLKQLLHIKSIIDNRATSSAHKSVKHYKDMNPTGINIFGENPIIEIKTVLLNKDLIDSEKTDAEVKKLKGEAAKNVGEAYLKLQQGLVAAREAGDSDQELMLKKQISTLMNEEGEE